MIIERDTSHTTSHTSFTQPYPPSHTHAHTPQVELSKSPAVAAWLMDVARGRWCDFAMTTQPAYMAACQIALAEPAGESSVAYTVTDALWRAIMKHGGSLAAAVSGLQVLARTAAAGGLEDRGREEDVGAEDAAREEAGHGALSHHCEGGSDERRVDAGDKRPVRVLRALLHHHESCPEVVKLCAR